MFLLLAGVWLVITYLALMVNYAMQFGAFSSRASLCVTMSHCWKKRPQIHTLLCSPASLTLPSSVLPETEWQTGACSNCAASSARSFVLQ
ncbi:uncharacterized protein BJX67DRAFT_352413 [Aspergillus lucknowensis]|uniref:Secreted protein n=1 Tax=Aspergillus lucknowensis TaxID=176173 RepID=A0ABR4LTZ9_9EURO